MCIETACLNANLQGGGAGGESRFPNLRNFSGFALSIAMIIFMVEENSSRCRHFELGKKRMQEPTRPCLVLTCAGLGFSFFPLDAWKTVKVELEIKIAITTRIVVKNLKIHWGQYCVS